MKSTSKLKRKNLNIHIGRMHKEDILQSTPEKECLEDESFLHLTLIKEVREEPLAEDASTCQLVYKIPHMGDTESLDQCG